MSGRLPGNNPPGRVRRNALGPRPLGEASLGTPYNGRGDHCPPLAFTTDQSGWHAKNLTCGWADLRSKRDSWHDARTRSKGSGFGTPVSSRRVGWTNLNLASRQQPMVSIRPSPTPRQASAQPESQHFSRTPLRGPAMGRSTGCDGQVTGSRLERSRWRLRRTRRLWILNFDCFGLGFRATCFDGDLHSIFHRIFEGHLDSEQAVLVGRFGFVRFHRPT